MLSFLAQKISEARPGAVDLDTDGSSAYVYAGDHSVSVSYGVLFCVHMIRFDYSLTLFDADAPIGPEGNNSSSCRPIGET